MNSFPIDPDIAAVEEFISWLEKCLSDHRVVIDVQDIYKEVSRICPGFSPQISQLSLDDRV